VTPRERLIDAAVRIVENEERLTADASMSLDAALDDFDQALRDSFRELLVDTFHIGWSSVPEGEPGARRSRGLAALFTGLASTVDR